MAIYAVGARPNRPQSEIVQAALGTEDENGVPFEIIEVQSLRNESNATSMHGCQDTLIELKSDIPGRAFTITHRDEGRIRWEKSWKSGGRPRAMLANTEKNLHFLAMHFYDGTLMILNSVVKAEVEARAKKIKEAMTDEQAEKEAKRLKDLKTFKTGGKVPTQGGLTPEQIELETEKKKLAERKRELDKREQGVDQKEAFVAKRIAGSVEATVKVMHERAELQAMNMGTLKKLARGYYRLQIADTMKKTEILDLIFKPIAPEKAPVEQVTG